MCQAQFRFQVLPDLILVTATWGQYSFHSSINGEETEAQRGQVNLPKLHNYQVADLGLNPVCL